jgi:hypothetical protein
VKKTSGNWTPILGYALSFTNPTLGVQLFGSPKEILDELHSRKLDLTAIANHPETEMEATEVLKDSPRLSFSGGPHAETMIELLDAIRESDLQKAAAVLERDPAALAAGHSGAAVPLLGAVSARRTEIARLLLRAGARVDEGGEFEMTPLHWAAALGAADLAAVLLGAGADVQRQTWFYVTAGELATINGHDAVARLIADRRDLSLTAFSVDRVLERMKYAAV